MEKMDEKIVTSFFKDLMDLYEFRIYIEKNSSNKNVFKVDDLQGGNLGEIEQDEFKTLADIMDRMEVYHDDYIYESLEERQIDGEVIEKNDWDLVAKRYIESDTINEILKKITPKKYEEMIDKLESFKNDDIIKILDNENKNLEKSDEKNEQEIGL